MKSIHTALLLADGFEEAEAFITLDMLARVHIPVLKISCQDSLQVTSYHQIPVVADQRLSETTTLFDAIILPGGPAGTDHLTANPAVIDFIKQHQQHQRYVCAICSAPAKVLGRHGLLGNKHYVCSGDLQQTVTEGQFVDAPVVIDGHLITGKGLGYAFDFGLAIADQLLQHDPDIAFQADHIYHPFQPELSVKEMRP